MHEMSIAVSLIDRVLEAARPHGASRIEEIEVEVGVLRQVVFEALEMAFTAVSEGTLAEAAVLKLTEIPASAECRSCGHRFPVAVDQYLCPQCNRADVEIVGGDDIVLRTITCQTEKDASVP